MERIQRRGRKSRRGLTLVELVVGTFIALFLTAAAVIFASHETKLLGYSTEQVDMQQQSRAAIDLLTRDVQQAGAGIGYSAAGVFLGLQTGSFNVPGPAGPGLLLNELANGHPVVLTPGNLATGGERGTAYTVSTHDIGMVYADGVYTTIAYANGNIGEICDDPGAPIDPANQLVVQRTEEGLTARSVFFQPSSPIIGACTYGQCAPIGAGGIGNGCRPYTLVPDPALTFQTDAAAPTINYQGGEILTGFKQVAWFVEQNAAPYDNTATLRRGVFDGTNNCPGGSPRINCGSEQAYNVETLQYQVYRFDTTAVPPVWTAVNPGPINTRDRLRVDFELVVRNRVTDGKKHDPIRLRLANACIPNNVACGAPPTPPPGGSGDNVPRRVHRWSVEVRNSGYMVVRSS